MIFSVDGILHQFLDLLGVQVSNPDAMYLCFIVCASLFACVAISFLVLLFKFLCYFKH